MRCGNSLVQPSSSNFYFSTGTDEHGKKIHDAANATGVSPENHCDVYSNRFMNLSKKFGIKYTGFTRTTSPKHIEAVNHFWTLLDGRGHIFKRSYEGWYSLVDECFYNDYEVVGHTTNDGKQIKVCLKRTFVNFLLKFLIAIETKTVVTKISEENYAFDLSQFYEQIRHWANQPDFTLEKAATLVNAYLVNDLGNLLQRSINPRLNPLKQYPIRTDINELLTHFDDETSKATAKQLIEKLETLPEIATEHYDNQNIHRVLDLLVELVQLANLFFQQCEPWKIINSQIKLDSVLFITYETVRLTAIYLQPATPDFADKLLSILGIPHAERTIEAARFLNPRTDSGTVGMEKNEAVFPRIALNK
uniref:Methionine--tRNA ligase, mitochondrial n=1 Tax=Meloidogyne hapla TaxID=6305 RepID=A0A1I8BIQ3_MELHA